MPVKRSIERKRSRADGSRIEKEADREKSIIMHNLDERSEERN